MRSRRGSRLFISVLVLVVAGLIALVILADDEDEAGLSGMPQDDEQRYSAREILPKRTPETGDALEPRLEASSPSPEEEKLTARKLRIRVITADGLALPSAAIVSYRPRGAEAERRASVTDGCEFDFRGPGWVSIAIDGHRPQVKRVTAPGTIKFMIESMLTIAGRLRVDGNPPGEELLAVASVLGVDDTSEAGTLQASARRAMPTRFSVPIAADGTFELRGFISPWSVRLELPFPLVELLNETTTGDSLVEIQSSMVDADGFVIDATRARDTLTGRTIDGEGEPVQGVLVSPCVFSPSGKWSVALRSTLTDPDGRFHFAVDWGRKRRVSLLFEKDGAAATFTLEPAEEGHQDLGDIVFDTTEQLGLTVLDDLDSKPIAGAWVIAAAGKRPTYVDDDGRCLIRFALSGDGEETLQVFAPGYEPLSLHPPDQGTELVARLTPTPTLTIEVLDDLHRPLAGWLVHLEADNPLVVDPSPPRIESLKRLMSQHKPRFSGGARRLRVETGEDGLALVSGLRSEPGFIVGIKEPQGGGFVVSRSVAMAAGSRDERVQLVLPSDRFVDATFEVSNSLGELEGGANVVMATALGGSRTGVTSLEGRCVFGNLDTRVYGRSNVKVSVTAKNGESWKSEVALSERENRISVKLSKPVYCTVCVVDEDGDRVDAVCARVMDRDGSWIRGRKIGEGQFEFEDMGASAQALIIDVGAESWSQSYRRKAVISPGETTDLVVPAQGMVRLEGSESALRDFDRIVFEKDGKAHMFFVPSKLPNEDFLLEAGTYVIRYRNRETRQFFEGSSQVRVVRGSLVTIPLGELRQEAD